MAAELELLLAWKIPQTKKPGRLRPMGSQGVRHNRATSLLSASTKSLWDFKSMDQIIVNEHLNDTESFNP